MSYILVVDDEESLRYTFAEFLIEEGFSVKTASTVEEAISVLKKALPDVVVADIRLPDGSGIELLDKVKKESHIIPVILITGYPEVKTASEAVRRGAYDYLVKPVRQETLTHVVRLSKRQKELAEEKERYRANLEALFLSIEDGIVIVDSDMRILQINQGVEKICGFFKDEVSGKKHDTLKRDCGGRCSELLARSISERMVCMETALRCFHVGRANQVVNIKSFPLFWGGGFKGGVMLIRDVTFYSKDTRVEDQWRFHKLIGKTEVMNKLYRTIESVSDVDSTVLITGETGTGKELVAEAIHFFSQRKDAPLVKVNCAALSPGLLESELFGHVKGAFTGAMSDRKGRFELANGGTIFLDEIGDLPDETQVKLLRVLQEKKIERVGDAREISLDVRVIAATNRDLNEMLKSGRFREDLFYRLNVVKLRVPPLRERKGDIPLLSEYFVDEFAMRFKKPVKGVSEEVLALFMEYDWPGNVRELMHLLEHAVIVTPGEYITGSDLPQDSNIFKGGKQIGASPLEKEEIFAALKEAGGNKAKAARLLGISRQTLYRKLKEYEV